MRIVRLVILFYIMTFISCTSSVQEKDVDYACCVNPFIGTDFTGNTYPGAQVPFGMVQLSPDNGLPGWDRIAGYFYPDSTIAGFSHTHLSGTGAGDLYDVSFMPVTLPYKKADAPLGIYSKFSHQDEEAYAGYYRVMLSDYNINVELTATPRCGIQRYTFPRAEAAIFLNLAKAMNWDETLDSYIEIVDSTTLRGYRYSNGWARNQKIYFYAKISKPFKNVVIDTVSIDKEGKRIGTGYVAQLNYTTKENEQVLVKTAISGVSMEGAERNWKQEAQENDFDFYLRKAKEIWNHELGKIQVHGGDENDKTVFYTALYHSMLAPTIYDDVNGDYYGPDGKVHTKAGWINYSTFSLWDTYRAQHPLFTLIQPDRVNDMIKSFLAFYEQNGRLPVWNLYGSETDMMIGYHAASVIAEAYLKGIGDFDPKKALEACVHTANIDEYRGIGVYKEKGYIPYDLTDPYNSENWSLSKTLEYAYDDYCIAKMAEKMGEKSIADTFYTRSQNYKNVYNPVTSFMQPRAANGEFLENFNAEAYTPYITESNGWQYFWSVQHDIKGLIALCGGKKRFEEKLDSMFTLHAEKDELPIFSTGMIGQYAHGNEPSHHVAYLYNFVDKPHKSQKYISEIVHDLYRNTPDGLCGNEDCGQMSAWYVFSAMGLYPVNPVSCKYELGTPLFPEMCLNLPDGNTFKILAKDVSRKKCYVKSVKLNGQLVHRNFITHEEIRKGGLLEFEMTDSPM